MSDTVTHLASTEPAEAVAGALARDGVVVIDELVSHDVMDAVEAELAPFVATTPTGPDDFSGHNTRRTGALIARSPVARELVMHPLVLGTVGAALGHATNHQLHLTQLISIGPGEPAPPIHRDQWAFDVRSFPSRHEVP